MRVVFMGTPEFAAASLQALRGAGHEVVSVFTQPDRPAGRGNKLTPPPVKRKALELGLAVEQPDRLRAPEVVQRLREIAPRAIAVVGYGQLIPQPIIDLPPLGCVNVHSSLLPKYRGAAPMNWAIARGETVTGVTTMLIEKRLDAGDILLARETPIGPDETAPELAARLAPMGAELLLETLEKLERGEIEPRTQNDGEASYAPIMKREDGLIDWNLPAAEIYNQIRGFEPWPGSYTTIRGKRLHIRRARPADGPALGPGRLDTAHGLIAGCGGGTCLRIGEVQLEGKNRIPSEDFVRGYRPRPDELLGANGPNAR